MKVGQFEYIEGEGLYGPKEFMNQVGNTLLDNILAGKDQVFNICASKSPDVITAVLVRLQTEYAGWHGIRSFCAAHNIK